MTGQGLKQIERRVGNQTLAGPCLPASFFTVARRVVVGALADGRMGVSAGRLARLVAAHGALLACGRAGLI